MSQNKDELHSKLDTTPCYPASDKASGVCKNVFIWFYSSSVAHHQLSTGMALTAHNFRDSRNTDETAFGLVIQRGRTKRKEIKEQIVRWGKKKPWRNAYIYQLFCWPNKQSVLLKPASKGNVENKICHFSMAQLCSLSSLCLMRMMWLKLLGSLSLVIKSRLCQPSDPLHCSFQIWVSSQLPGPCCRSPNASDPSLLQPISSPRHPPA